jgi:hypothetical protein
MAQGPDCKIYMSPANGSYSLHVINKPDEHGKACDFVQNGIKLPNSNGGSLPNFPRFRVDEKEKCNPGITSLFGEQVYFRRNLNVFPNPTHGILNLSQAVDRVIVYDLLAQVIQVQGNCQSVSLELLDADKAFTTTRKEIVKAISDMFNVETDEYKRLEAFVMADDSSVLDHEDYLVFILTLHVWQER